MHYHSISIIHIEIQSDITQIEFAPSSPYFSIKSIYLVDINMFARFDGISTKTLQDIKEIKCNQRTDKLLENSIPPKSTVYLGKTICR